MWPYFAKNPKKLFSILFLFSQTALYANVTLKFSVNILGIPAGHALYKEKPKQECITHKNQICTLSIYFIKLNWDILQNLQIISYVWLNENSELDFNKFLIQKENDKNEIQIFYNPKKNTWQILNNKVLVQEILGNEKVHTLASLPLYFKNKKPNRDGKVQVILQNEIKNFEYEILQQEDLIKIQYQGQDYLIFRTPQWQPEYIRLVPIKVFGLEFGEISATRLP